MRETENVTSDSLSDKRYSAYSLIAYLGQKTEKADLRKHAAKKLIEGSNDKDGGIGGYCLKMLTYFSVSDFDLDAKVQLAEMAKKPRTHYELIIKLCGWLNIKELGRDFRSAVEEKKGGMRERWAMRIALARMGEADMVAYCSGRLLKAGVSDDVVYDFFPDVIYTRQKTLFDYLLTIIESDQKQCSSSNPDSDEKIICAFRVIELVAPYIKDFPAKTDVAGGLVSTNYDQTLKEVRIWIQQNRTTYTILGDGF